MILLADTRVYSQSTMAIASPTMAIKHVNRSYSLHLLKLLMKLFSNFFLARYILTLSYPIFLSMTCFDFKALGLLALSGAFVGSNCILTPGLLRARRDILELESLDVANFSSPPILALIPLICDSSYISITSI